MELLYPLKLPLNKRLYIFNDDNDGSGRFLAKASLIRERLAGHRCATELASILWARD